MVFTFHHYDKILKHGLKKKEIPVFEGGNISEVHNCSRPNRWGAMTEGLTGGESQRATPQTDYCLCGSLAQEN